MYGNNGWITRFKNIHGEHYGYDKIPENVRSEVAVPIFCFIHNEYFMQLPRFHAKGHGCPKCARQMTAEKHRLGKDGIINLARKAHPDLDYDYSQLSEVVKIMDKVLIGCPECGSVFKQRLNDHIHAKAGCPKCGHLKGGEKTSLTKNKFIERAKEIHSNKYGYYYLPDTIRAHIKVPILCNKHNILFYQDVRSHLQGIGCPRCGKNISRVEDKLYTFIKEEKKNIICRHRGWTNNKYEIDLFLPNQRIGIEYNGLAYHHSAEGFTGYKEPSYHKEKSDLALSAKIRLYHIFEGIYSLNALESMTHDILNHRRIINSEHYYLKKRIRYGIVYRDLCPFKEDSFFYRHNWMFVEWKPYAFYWKPGSPNGRNTFNISKVPKQGYRPVYTSGVWVFKES